MRWWEVLPWVAATMCLLWLELRAFRRQDRDDENRRAYL